MRKLYIFFITMSILLSSCSTEDNDDPIVDDIQYSAKFSNPIDNYTVADGSKVTLTVELDGQMSVASYEAHFYIDDQEITVTPISEYDVNLFINNYAYEWNVVGFGLGDHQLKVEFVDLDTVVARDEITITVVPMQWEKVDISNLVGSSSYVISDIFLLDENVGWVSGYAGGMNFLLKTTDKGSSWQLVNSDFWMKKIAFYDENNGVVIDYYSSKVYQTNDGGATFTLVTDPATGNSLFYSAIDVGFSQINGEFQATSPRYADDSECVFRVKTGSENDVLQTTLLVDDPNNSGAFKIRFDGSNGLIYNMQHIDTDLHYIAYTSDNGLNWEITDVQPPADWFGGTSNYAIEGGDVLANKIWLSGGDTSDYLSAFSAVSNDAGNTWKIEKVTDKLSFNTQSFLDVAMTADGNAFAINYESKYFPAMYFSNDDGTTWIPLYEVTPDEDQHIDKIEFKAGNFGIAAGENVLYKYLEN